MLDMIMKKLNPKNCNTGGVYYIFGGYISFVTACFSTIFFNYANPKTKPKKIVRDYFCLASGKLRVRKTSTCRATVIYLNLGKLSLTGLATLSSPVSNYSYSTSGKLTVSGLFNSIPNYSYRASGRLTANGLSNSIPNYLYRANGRFTATGLFSTTLASSSHTYSTSGKLSFNGLATCTNDSDSSMLTASDFTYLGAYILPRDPMPGCESIYGKGLAMRTENSDGVNPLHFLSAAYGGVTNHSVYEWRDTTPGMGGADPLNPANYTEATVVKTYGDIYSDKKRIIYQGNDVPLTNQLDGDFGLHWDETDSRLYWSYGFGYSNDTNSWCLGYSTLNYAANTGTGFGPWRLSGQSWKALQAGLTPVPPTYASTYLSGKRLAIGFGGYYSIVGACDASLGPSLTAIDAIVDAEESDLACTPLVGYWPVQGTPSETNGRCDRPEPRIMNPTAAYNIDADWPPEKFSWNDRVRAGVWIDTGTKRGVIFFGTYGRGYNQYISSTLASTTFGHYWAIYDPDDFTPVSGTARYNIQPTEIYNYQYPVVDYSGYPYTEGATQNITSITSVNGQPQNSASSSIVVTVPSHGLTTGQGIDLRDSSQAIYNAIWQVTVLDSDTFRIHNTSSPYTWDGSTATGGTIRGAAGGIFDSPIGACYDANTGKLYLAVTVAKGFNGLQSRVFMHVYQVAS